VTSIPTTFGEDGWFVVPDVFDPAACDDIVGHVERAAFELALGDAGDGPLSYRPMMHLASPELTAAATDRRWAPIVLPLLGTGDARLYWEQAVAKPPQARTELPWHQDNGYTPLDPEEYVTCWLALDDADVDNGCLWVIPGSHRHGTVRHRNGAGPFRVGHDGPAADGVPVPVRRGSVLVFSSLLLHRSGPNTTDRPRRAWIIQFCSAAARSALSGRVLDDRLLCATAGEWLDEPVREREFDLAAVLANYDQR
jgi:ectoine hydroxylase-related dioxygenase (phytanoyl-CoA dioxygenase family)